MNHTIGGWARALQLSLAEAIIRTFAARAG
jgi:hypothetical protein